MAHLSLPSTPPNGRLYYARVVSHVTLVGGRRHTFAGIVDLHTGSMPAGSLKFFCFCFCGSFSFLFKPLRQQLRSVCFDCRVGYQAYGAVYPLKNTGARARARTHARTHMCTHTHMHARMYVHTHARTHTHIHTHLYARARAPPPPPPTHTHTHIRRTKPACVWCLVFSPHPITAVGVPYFSAKGGMTYRIQVAEVGKPFRTALQHCSAEHMERTATIQVSLTGNKQISCNSNKS